MNLYLHIGTEKTGSSFIQTSLGQSRKHLKEFGFYFPKAGKREKKMLTGKISPGNGNDLRVLLNAMRFDQVSSLLTEYIKQAKRKECHSIVLSNELLFEALGNSTIINGFLDILEELGLVLKPILLFIREPVDQALSLYQHRSKAGSTPPLQSWLEEGYVVPIKLYNFLNEVERVKLKTKVRKYKKDSSFLMEVVIQDWLKLKETILWKDQIVNPSLTLSELEVIRQYRLINPWLVEFLYNHLLCIPGEKKAKDQALKRACQKIIQAEVQKHQKVWTRLNEFLPVTEQLTTSSEPSNQEVNIAEEYAFSKTQLETILHFQNEIRTTSFKLQLAKKKIRRAMSQMKYETMRKIQR